MKLRQMGTLGVHVKGVLSWLVRWFGTIDFCPALAALEQNLIFLGAKLYEKYSLLVMTPFPTVEDGVDLDCFVHRRQ